MLRVLLTIQITTLSTLREHRTYAQTLKNEELSVSDINFTAEMYEEEETKTTSIKNDALLNERKAMVGSKSALGLSLPNLDDF
jgi:uncharacterized membrane protein